MQVKKVGDNGISGTGLEITALHGKITWWHAGTNWWQTSYSNNFSDVFSDK